MLALEVIEQGRDGNVRGCDGQTVAIFLAAQRYNRGQTPKRIFIGAGFRFESELDQMVAAKLGDQLGRRALSNDAALINNGDTVTQPFRLIHVVCRQQDGSALGPKVAKDVPELPTRVRVEPDGWLVEEQ